MMIDDIRLLEEALHESLGWFRQPVSEPLDRLTALVAAFDALAPDWSQAPRWAHWYTINPNGLVYWWEFEPVGTYVGWNETATMGEVKWHDAPDLPLGLDWRLCIWQRPDAA